MVEKVERAWVWGRRWDDATANQIKRRLSFAELLHLLCTTILLASNVPLRKDSFRTRST
jgi:hypothetical protein